jgi:hypothetical protein
MNPTNKYAEIDYLERIVTSQVAVLIVLLLACLVLIKLLQKANARADDEREERRAVAKELNESRKEYIPILLNVTRIMEGLKNAIDQKIK